MEIVLLDLAQQNAPLLYIFVQPADPHVMDGAAFAMAPLSTSSANLPIG